MDWEKIPVEHITPDPQVAHLVEEWGSKVGKIVDVEIGFSKRELSEPELKRITEQALRDERGVDFAFQNRGGIRDNLPKGRILARHIWNIHPFDNWVAIGRFRGSGIPAAVRDGRQLDPEKEYTLACSDYVAENQHETGTHGLQFPAKREGQVRDYVIDWIKKRKVIE